jgi:hypothetical protein
MELSDYERPPYQISECLRCGETMFLPEWSGYMDRHRMQHLWESMFLPEWSGYMDRHRMQHLWECEACGYKFKTFVSLSDY